MISPPRIAVVALIASCVWVVGVGPLALACATVACAAVAWCRWLDAQTDASCEHPHD